MSWSASWRLPTRELDRARIDAALAKLVRPPAMKLGTNLGDGDFDDDELDLGSIEVSVGVLGRLLSEHGDSPESEPDDEGYFWGHLALYPGDEDDERAFIVVDSNDGQNRSCWMTIGDLAGRLSVALGGPEEPEPE